MNKPKAPTLSSDLQLLGIPMRAMEECIQGAMGEEGEGEKGYKAATQAVRRLIKDARKEKMKEVHPDKGGDTDLAQEINAAADRALIIRIVPPAPQPQVRIVFQQTWSGTASSSGTTTTSTGTGWW